MRPLRSFLLLLIFLACLTGLHYLIPSNHLFPSIVEFIPQGILDNLKPESLKNVKRVDAPSDTAKTRVADTLASIGYLQPIHEKLSDNPLQGFLDSLSYSRGQIRIIYYGDSQIEGDRVTSYLRHTLRSGKGGTGPGLFLPLTPVMYSRSVWLSSSSNWIRYNYLSYKTGEISHKNLGPFMAICWYLPEGKTTFEQTKAYVKIRPSKIADSTTTFYDRLRLF